MDAVLATRQANEAPAADAPAQVRAEPALADSSATPSLASPSRLDLVGARLRRTFNAGFEQVLDTLEAREPWERYRPHDTTLPPTFPARTDAPVTDVAPSLRGMAYSTQYDIHYDGDFVIPGRPNAAVRFSDVMARPDWPSFILENLTAGNRQPGDPMRVMVPGLNATNSESVRRIPVVTHDTNLAIATIDNASVAGLEPITLTLPGGKRVTLNTRAREWIQAVFQRTGVSFGPRPELLPDVPRDAQGRVEVPPRSGQWLSPAELRNLHSALNELSDPNKTLIDNTQRLIMAHIDRGDLPPLELWGYSEGSLVLGKVFEDLEARYLAERMRDCPREQRTQRLAALRARFRAAIDRVSVLCIGSAYGQFNTPVTRIDFYAADAKDQVSRFAGSRRMTGSYRFVHDTVLPPAHHDALIPYEQPFKGLDAHNLFAAGGSALALYLELNGTRSMRELYERERAGTMVHPTLEQVTARIRQNGGERELWDQKNKLPPAP